MLHQAVNLLAVFFFFFFLKCLYHAHSRKKKKIGCLRTVGGSHIHLCRITLLKRQHAEVARCQMSIQTQLREQLSKEHSKYLTLHEEASAKVIEKLKGDEDVLKTEVEGLRNTLLAQQREEFTYLDQLMHEQRVNLQEILVQKEEHLKQQYMTATKERQNKYRKIQMAQQSEREAIIKAQHSSAVKIREQHHNKYGFPPFKHSSMPADAQTRRGVGR